MSSTEWQEEVQEVLARAADTSGEVLALCEDAGETNDLDQILNRMQELHLLIWRLRWKLGPIQVRPATKGGAS